MFRSSYTKGVLSRSKYPVPWALTTRSACLFLTKEPDVGGFRPFKRTLYPSNRAWQAS